MAMTWKGGKGYLRIRGADVSVDRTAVRVRLADYPSETARREDPRAGGRRRELILDLGTLAVSYLTPARAWCEGHEAEWAERLATARTDTIAELQRQADEKAKAVGVKAVPVTLSMTQESTIKRQVLNQAAAERAEAMARQTVGRVGAAESTFRAALYEALHELPEFAGAVKA